MTSTSCAESSRRGASEWPNLEEFRLPGVDAAFYIPSFISPEEEDYLLRKVESAPKAKWRTLNGRRLQVWGGELTSANALIPQTLPSWLLDYPDVLPRIGRTGAFSGAKRPAPNHVIVNEYSPGQGIFAHKDGPAYHPVVATLTLASHAVFHYHPPLSNAPAFSVLLEPRSLIITMDELYTECSHSIDAVDGDDLGSNRVLNADRLSGRYKDAAEMGELVMRDKRVSLTCRVVEKVGRGFTTGK